MGQTSIDAVIAGTKGFAVALLAPLTARIGNRPRVAADPGQVLGLCSGPGALAVIEFTEGALPGIQALVRDGNGLRVVVGLPAVHAAAEGSLLALGAQVGRWDGKVEGVASAVDRAIAAMAGEPAAEVAVPAPRPAATRPAPAGTTSAAAPPAAGPRAPAGPVVAARAAPAAPAAAKAVAPPAAKPPAAAPAAGARPAAPAPAKPAGPGAAAPVAKAAAPVAPAAAKAPAPPAGAKSAAPVPARPAAAAPIAPAAAAAPAAPAPAKAAAPVAPRPAPAPAPKAEPGVPVLTKQPVLAPAKAAAQPVAPAPAAPPPAAPASVPAAPPPADAAPASGGVPSVARPPANFFDDLGDDVSVDITEEEPAEAAASPGVNFHAPGVYVPPSASASAPKAAWPAGICSAVDAEAALQLALAGNADAAQPLHALALTTLESLSELERDVLEGKPPPVDAGPIRKAAVMRLRVAAVLASAPAAAGSAVDTVALSGILGEIDGLLAEVAPLLQGAPEELAPALEAIRNALVSEAIDFSETAQRVAGNAPAPQQPRTAPRTPAARVLSIEQPMAGPEPGRGRQIALVVLFVVMALAVAAYHGMHWYQIQQLKKSPPGLPSGLTDSGAPANLPRMITPTDAPTDPAEIEKFKADEAAKGNQVIDTGNGTMLVVPGAAPKDKPGGSK